MDRASASKELRSVMSVESNKLMPGDVASLNREIEEMPRSAQVIVSCAIDRHVDLALLVEYRGKRERCYASDLVLIERGSWREKRGQ